MRLVLLAAALLVATALAGCASEETNDSTTAASGTGTTTGTRTTGTLTSVRTSGTTSGTGTTGTSGLSADLTATPTSGSVPLTVTFGISSSGGAVRSWTLVYGDGGDSETGADSPATRTHEYVIAGTFTAKLTVQFTAGGSAEDTVTITTTAADDGPPPESHFEYGPSAGCDNSLVPGSCISLQAGPDAPPIDGFWQALDDRYWNKAFVTTIDAALPDSDCVFVAADGSILGEAHNLDQECGGVVPPGTAWIFLYPYVQPSQGMTIDFTF